MTEIDEATAPFTEAEIEPPRRGCKCIGCSANSQRRAINRLAHLTDARRTRPCW